jgi:hypothetical protein
LEFNMISASLIVPLLLSSQMIAGTERQQYSRCLRTFLTTQLEERVAPAAFDTAIAGACAQQEAAYRAAFIAAATRAGDRRPVAERDVETEVEDLRANFKEQFRDAQPEPSAGSQ